MFIHARFLWLCIALLGSIGIPPVARAPIVLVPQPHLWMPEGPISAIARQGNTLYLGGSFQHVGPLTGGLATLDITDDHVIQGGPQIIGTVWTSVADGTGGWYIGGSFSSGFEGRPLANLVHIRADGQLDYSWDSQVSGTVQALAISAGMLYVAGDFTMIGRQMRRNLAAIDLTTGAVADWQPDPDGPVFALALHEQRIYVGGFFQAIQTQPRQSLAAFDQASGALLDWNADLIGQSWVVTLLADAGTLYVGGEFSTLQGQTRHNLAAIDLNSGHVRDWHPDPDATVWALAISGPDLYVGGNFTTIAGQSRDHLAAFDRVHGAIHGWQPNVGGNVMALAITGDTVYVGGDLNIVNGRPQAHLRSIDRLTGAHLPWNPNPNGPVYTITIINTTIMIGGDFSLALRWPRTNLAALDLTTGLPTAWAPDMTKTGYVKGLAIVGQTLYVGGVFAMIDGQLRTNLAAFDLATATLDQWNPSIKGRVNALAATHSIIAIGGLFEDIGQVSANLASVDPGSGTVTLWKHGICKEVQVLALSGQTLYAGGTGFTSVVSACTDTTGQEHHWLGAFDVDSGGLLPWAAYPNGDVQAIVVRDGIVYAGGSFDTINGQSRFHVAALDQTSAALLAWQPPMPDVYTGATSVSALVSAGSLIYIAYHTPTFDSSSIVVVDLNQAESHGKITVMRGRINTMLLSDGLLSIGNSFLVTNDRSLPVSLGVWREPAYTIFMPTLQIRFPAS